MTALKEYTQRGIDVLEEFLRLEYAPPEELKAWRTQLGINHRLSIETQKQKIWSTIFKELADLLRPFCIQGSRKHLHLKYDDRSMPDLAFKNASRLMHLAHPNLWPDNWKLVKARYNQYSSLQS